ncbi:hypothetical protein [Oceanobacillus jeddahense]|uniref:hypothetical protein n=1 Tax=Oceanobacillus jeddahense TaxID=1462527 RepID=UPI000595C38E|nr:hypothetical protein [Oceanobacillus jeddahense]
MLRKVLLDVGFYTLIVVALLSAVYMMVTINNLNTDIEQLRQENHEIREQRNELIDAVWSNNNRQMMGE